MTDLDTQSEEIRGARGKRESGGASVDSGTRDSRDGRVSKALGWFWGMVGAGLAGAVILAANNLYQLNVTVALSAMSAAQAAKDRDADRADIRSLQADVINLKGDVRELQGKTFRGVAGYPKEAK